MEPIRVGILQDAMGTSFATPEEEKEQILKDLAGIFRRPVKLTVADRNIVNVIKSEPELLIIDYGGMSIYGASTMAEWTVQAARTWADENPSKVLCIWSHYTELIYAEVSELLPELPNVVVHFSDTQNWEAMLQTSFGLHEQEIIDSIPAGEKCRSCYHTLAEHNKFKDGVKISCCCCDCWRFIEQSLEESKVTTDGLSIPGSD